MPTLRPIKPTERSAQREHLEQALANGDVTIGQAIKTIRRDWMGIPQKRMAEIAGISVGTLSSIERDSGNVTVANINRVLRVFGGYLNIRLK
ncbi:helix-turn-helix protein [Halospina denitrificans]|uniref:Helix-turn-helix protein n=1 Tax=Halospina denitrificans TaxID=332522 RepID=A0A4R7JYB7_9GAMM|nr:helix-turn-helix domain-containing protein [Halospina denitrificans]TDT43175.1 helix-turn-helix protein [Halospina denitrificans]